MQPGGHGVLTRVRFVLFVPEEELSSVERIAFQLEEAHWFYEDFVKDINPESKSLQLKFFLARLYPCIPPSVIAHVPQRDAGEIHQLFMNYKGHVPVRGVIMLNEAMDKCVMVKGWKGGASWSFPRGKIEKNETDIECAEREAWEETGVIVEGLVLPENKLEHRVHGKQEVWMYVIPGIPEDTKFEAKTRNEISRIDWHSVDKLPGWHKSTRKGGKDINTPVKPSKYYLIHPFVILLRQWM
ncbi:NUDIX hydrolase domain-like protein, partial [Pyronema domesticum]